MTNLPRHMRAWTYDAAGAARKVMTEVTLDVCEPGPGEVLVEVKVSAVNPTDVKRRSTGRELGLFSPIIPNNDGTGIIAGVGEGVSSSRIGEPVWLFGAQAGRPHGTAAQYTCLPSDQAITLPARASFTDGACIGVPAVTAWHAVLGGGPVEGSTVLVTGAGGRVGRYAVQVAAHAGARVIATTRAEKFAGLKALGAHEVIDYTDDGFADALRAAAPGGVDRVADGALWLTLEAALPALGTRVHIAAYASDQNASPALPFAKLLYANTTIEAFSIFGLSKVQQQAAIDGVNGLLTDGKLDHKVGARFSFAQMIEAHEAVEAGSIDGNCLVTIR
ncbi:MAG: NADPH:quinone reductase [Anderseniella sp.]|nr:NADPH:quinone reductase [Anderseniella sp.]